VRAISRVGGLYGCAFAVVLVMTGCDGGVHFRGSTSEALIGTVAGGGSPLTAVSISLSLRDDEGTRVIAFEKSDHHGRFGIGVLVPPFTRAAQCSLAFEKEGFEPLRVDLSKPAPAGAKVSPCPGTSRRDACRIVDVVMTPKAQRPR
jgi:hypothetical protein